MVMLRQADTKAKRDRDQLRYSKGFVAGAFADGPARSTDKVLEGRIRDAQGVDAEDELKGIAGLRQSEARSEAAAGRVGPDDASSSRGKAGPVPATQPRFGAGISSRIKGLDDPALLVLGGRRRAGPKKKDRDFGDLPDPEIDDVDADEAADRDLSKLLGKGVSK